uniref:Uncharacterized protein n=1 Tax=Coccidioides posadasii RMSCC 3488 TaxID=454284 RepID=A0A0J6FKA0_COCPO|nr:hypothetical protein CPAG_05579 [Coccidioides posadasii RMSCC 3488]
MHISRQQHHKWYGGVTKLGVAGSEYLPSGIEHREELQRPSLARTQGQTMGPRCRRFLRTDPPKQRQSGNVLGRSTGCTLAQVQLVREDENRVVPRASTRMMYRTISKEQYSRCYHSLKLSLERRINVQLHRLQPSTCGSISLRKAFRPPFIPSCPHAPKGIPTTALLHWSWPKITINIEANPANSTRNEPRHHLPIVEPPSAEPVEQTARSHERAEVKNRSSHVQKSQLMRKHSPQPFQMMKRLSWQYFSV